jgi:hypothetical protein
VKEPPTIEHNPHEKREPWWLWWAVFGVIGVFWLLQIRHGFEWGQIALGLMTGLFIGVWAMDMTGGEVPASWRRKPPRQR